MPFSLNQVATKLCIEAGYPSTDLDFIALIEEWLNEAYTDLVNAVRWDFNINTEETVTTVASTAEYSLTASVGETTSARITTTDQKIYFLRVEDLVASGVNMEEEGTPRYWYFSGYTESTGKTKIKFWPIPSAVLTIKMTDYRRPAVLGSSTTIPLPDDFIGLLKDMARVQIAMDDGRNDDANVIQGRIEFRLGIRRNRQHTNPAEERQRPAQDTQAGLMPLPNAGSKYDHIW